MDRLINMKEPASIIHPFDCFSLKPNRKFQAHFLREGIPSADITVLKFYANLEITRIFKIHAVRDSNGQHLLMWKQSRNDRQPDS
jgi:hypothetical protein